MRKYKCKYDIEFQDIKEILDFMDDHYADKTAFIYKSKDRKSPKRRSASTSSDRMSTVSEHIS